MRSESFAAVLFSSRSTRLALCRLTAILVTFAVTSSWGSISFVQQNSAVPQSPQSIVTVGFNSAQQAGDTNLVAIGWNDSTSSIVSVTDSKGNSYTLAVGPTRQAGIHSQSIYVAKNVLAASAKQNTVTVTFSAAVSYPDVRIVSYRGLDSLAPVETSVGASGTGTSSSSGAITTTNSNDLLFAANYVSSSTKSAGSGFTSRVITKPNGDIAEDRIVTSGGSYSATANIASGNWVMQLVALKASGSQPTVATPTFSPAPGTFTSSASVSMSDATNGATIYYTTDGSTPTTSSRAYVTPIVITATTTVKALAAAPGYINSSVASGLYTILPPAAATPSFSPAPGTYSTSLVVSLSDSTQGATIYYTTDGTTPTTQSAVYAAPFNVGVSTTIKALAAATGYSNSPVATGVYTITAPMADAPTFTPAPGTFPTTQSVALYDTTPGATIYYTTDGSVPTTASTVYSAPILVSATTTLKAMAAASGYNNSSVATGSYVIGNPITIAFVQAAYAVPQTPQPSVSVAYSLGQSAGNTNVIAIGWSDSTTTVTAVSDSKGNTYVPAAGPTVQPGVQSQVIYVANNIAAASPGSNTVTVSFSAAVPYPDLRILEYSGLDPLSPVDGSSGAFGTGALSNSGVVTTRNAYDLIFSANYVTTGTISPGNGFVNREITSPDGDIAEDQIVTATGSYAGTATVALNGGWIQQTVALKGAGSAPPPPDPSVVGQWGGVAAWPILPIHVTLMPNGKVLAFGHDASNNTTLGTIWDPNANTFQPTTFNGADLFCSGHGLLADGRVFIVGGHNMQDYYGIKNATTFDPNTGAWASLPAMSYARWYPTITSLPDGRQLISSGAINCEGCNATIPEIYNPATNTWTKLTAAALNIPIYPHMFVLPDGRVLNTGSYELPVPTRALDLNSQAWTTIDSNVLDAGSSVMYLPGKILKTGTSANSDPPFVDAAPNAYVIDMTQGSPAWRAVNPMQFPRSYHNLTILPDGNVLVTGGEQYTNPFDLSTAVYAAEMWSPATEAFTSMASMVTPRVYHSTALLLPDGRVLVGGSGEYGAGSIDQLNAEIYSPPYLFKGARPSITSAPSVIHYGAQFSVQTPDASAVASVALIRLGSVTHGFNESQRYVPLAFTIGSGLLNIQGPVDANTAPPGHYMLFLVNASGVPSMAAILQVPVS